LDQYSRPQNEEKHSASDNNNVISLQACKVSKEQKQACKLQNLGTRISANTLQRFRRFVLDKHGKINGPFALEIEQALEFWISNQQQTTSYGKSFSNRTGRPRGDVIEKYKLIVQEIKRFQSFPVINLPTLRSVVKTILGKTDMRTFNKYLKGVAKLSEEQYTTFGIMPSYDVTRFVNKVQSDYW